MKSITEIFREKKLKLTPQRIAVYDHLSHTTSHPTAEAIYKSLQENFPIMSLATVYKSLNTLLEVELISELDLGEGNSRYDANVCDHPHIQCTECGKVEDIMGLSLSPLCKELSKHSDYTHTGTRVYFYGVCRECAKGKSRI